MVSGADIGSSPLERSVGDLPGKLCPTPCESHRVHDCAWLHTPRQSCDRCEFGTHLLRSRLVPFTPGADAPRVGTPRRVTPDTDSPPDLAAAIRAASQWGVLSNADLRACGMSRDAVMRRCRRGTLHPVFPGVYSVSAPPFSVQAMFFAATQATNGALSHYSAASLWRLVDFDEAAPPQVTISHGNRRTVPGIEVHRTRRPFKTMRLDGIPVTTP